MAQPGDIVMFEFPTPLAAQSSGLTRTPSTYGHINLELLPVPGDMYVVCYDGRFRHWPVDDVPIGWEFSIMYGVPQIRIAQYGFDPVEIRMRTIGRTDSPPEKACTVGTTIEFSHEAVIHECEDSGEDEVTSAPPPARRSKIGCVLA
jgi:hypothetical protein